MRLVLLALLATLMPPTGPQRRGSHPLLPWLHNLQQTVATDMSEPLDASAYENEPADEACEELAATAITLEADVAPSAGLETIIASYAAGVTVIGREGNVLASAPGYACAGTADTVEVLAAGYAFGAPTIALVATTGGRREQLTWLGLYRVTREGELDAVYTGAVEERVDGVVRRGSITILPGALLVRDPGGAVGFWVWDETSGTYLAPAAYEPFAGAHS